MSDPLINAAEKVRMRKKLTPDDVRQIRVLLATTPMRQQDIGERFGVCQATVRDIKNGKIWRHVE